MAVRGSVAKPESKPKKIGRRSGIDPELLGAAQRLKGRGAGVGGAREKGDYVDPELFGAAQRIKKQKADQSAKFDAAIGGGTYKVDSRFTSLDQINKLKAAGVNVTVTNQSGSPIDTINKDTVGGHKAKISDTIAEIITGGNAPTDTYNRKDLGQLYDDTAKEQARAYTDAYLELHQEYKSDPMGFIATHGAMPAFDVDKAVKEAMPESKQDFVDKAIRTSPSGEALLLDLGISMIPIVGTIKDWNRYGGKGRALMIGADLFFFLPVAGQLAAASRAGVGASKALSEVTIGIVKSPITTIKNPKAAIKSGLIDPAVMTVDMARLPSGAMEKTYHTIKINVDEFPSAKDAMSARDKLAAATMKEGEKGVTVKTKRGTVELTETPIQKVISPVAISATQDVRPFLQGAVVAEDKGSLFLAPNMHSRFTYSTSAGAVTEGGIPGGLIIRDPDVLKLLEGSKKTYRGDVEIEKVLPVGSKIPAPSDIITLMRPDGQQLIFLVIGKKFSATELAKLKLFGTGETLKQAFSKITQKKFTVKELREAETLQTKSAEAISNSSKLKKAADEAFKAKDYTRARDLAIRAREYERAATNFQARIGAIVNARASVTTAGAYFGNKDLESVFRDGVLVNKGDPRPGGKSRSEFTADTFAAAQKLRQKKIAEEKKLKDKRRETSRERDDYVSPELFGAAQRGTVGGGGGTGGGGRGPRTAAERFGPEPIGPTPSRETPTPPPPRKTPTGKTRETPTPPRETPTPPPPRETPTIKTRETPTPPRETPTPPPPRKTPTIKTRETPTPTIAERFGPEPIRRTPGGGGGGGGTTPKTPPRLPRFKLPNGKRMPAGQYPRVVHAPMGVVDVSADLAYPTVDYFSRTFASRKSPKDGLKIVSTMNEPPKPLTVKQGIMTMTVTPRDITFKRSRKL